jgi:hypothetical protein
VRAGCGTACPIIASFMKMVLAKGRTPAGRILRSKTIAEMLRPQNAESPMYLDYRIGLAWKLDEMAGSPAAGHGGDARRRHSSLLILPEEKLGVFVKFDSNELMNAVGNEIP